MFCTCFIGKEAGVFYAIDIGGTNLRVIRIELLGDGIIHEDKIDHVKCEVPQELMLATAKAEDLFGLIANQCKVLYDRHEDASSGKVLPMGFCFSWPCEQNSINSGIHLAWGCGYETCGSVGNDPVKLLSNAFERRKLPFDVKVLLNDSVATLMACSYCHPHAKIGATK